MTEGDSSVWQSIWVQLGALGLLLVGAGIVIRALWAEKLAADARDRVKAAEDAEMAKAWIAAVNGFTAELTSLRSTIAQLAEAARGKV